MSFECLRLGTFSGESKKHSDLIQRLTNRSVAARLGHESLLVASNKWIWCTEGIGNRLPGELVVRE
ncbi:MAG TPA: hypothetical protein DCE55_28605 [Planctomycetaceae bacterium]|nr:hypothetical protein [Planctomycetaceae bacterium]